MFHIVVQKEVLFTPLPPSTQDMTIHHYSADGNWTDELKLIEDQIYDTDIVFLHASLNIAKRLQSHLFRRRFPKLSLGISLPEHGLFAHKLISGLGDIYLNQNSLFLPFCKLRDNENLIHNHFGPDIFLRPDSPMKPFSGRPIAFQDWDREISSISQIERPDPGLMCLVAKSEDIIQPEWRFWMIEEKISTFAPYEFEKNHPLGMTPPKELCDIAILAAQKMISTESLLVVDATFKKDGTPVVVECNAFSTSGLYAGADLEKMWTDMKNIF